MTELLLEHNPIPPSVHVYLNGIEQRENIDWTLLLSPPRINVLPAMKVKAGDLLEAQYAYIDPVTYTIVHTIVTSTLPPNLPPSTQDLNPCLIPDTSQPGVGQWHTTSGWSWGPAEHVPSDPFFPNYDFAYNPPLAGNANFTFPYWGFFTLGITSSLYPNQPTAEDFRCDQRLWDLDGNILQSHDNVFLDQGSGGAAWDKAWYFGNGQNYYDSIGAALVVMKNWPTVYWAFRSGGVYYRQC